MTARAAKPRETLLSGEALQSPLELSLEAGTRKNHTGEGDRAAG